MEKTLRKCGSSSGVTSHSSNVDINSLPFVIPKRYQIKSNRFPELDYHLDIHRFNYTYKTENAILASKREREAAEQAAADQAAAEEAAAIEEAAAQDLETEPGECSAQDGDSAGAHPTNPFLALSGEVLVPTVVAGVKPKENDSGTNNHDIINTFDVQNSNPFDGAELQSLSDFDALKSVLSPDISHDYSLLDKSLASQSTGDEVYTQVVGEVSTDITPTPEPVYTTVNRDQSAAPAVIKSKKLDTGSHIHVTNGPQIHNSFAAVGTRSGFEVPPSYSPPTPAHTPPAQPAKPDLPPSYSPFPKIPEEVVARAMQRVEHNQEQCFVFLKEVLEVMGQHDCSAEVAESVLIELAGSEKPHEETIQLIKQFSELGFTVQDIVKGLKQKPQDRDALLDLLVINA